MAFDRTKEVLRRLFGGASSNEPTTSIEITASELFHVLKPVLSNPKDDELVSLGIDSAIQRTLEIIASSKCEYSNDIHNFRNSLTSIANNVPAMSKADTKFTISIATLQTLMASRICLMSVVKKLNQQSDTLTKQQSKVVQLHATTDRFDFFAAPDHLTDTEIDHMKDTIIKFDDSLSAFLNKHNITPPQVNISTVYEPTSRL